MEEIKLAKTTIQYNASFLTKDEADNLYAFCQTLPTADHEVVVYGKRVKQPRKSCMYGYNYTYAKSTIHSLGPLPPELAAVADKITAATGQRCNACLVNYYPTGNDYIANHSDNETDLCPDSLIIGLSVGAVRNFDILPRDRTGGEGKTRLPLAHGSIVVMGEGCQENYTHGVPKQANVVGGRYSLTFRLMGRDFSKYLVPARNTQTITELKTIARAIGIVGYSKMKAADKETLRTQILEKIDTMRK
jgi:alkylated DNA repair dioxygenase AlkB